MKFLLKKGIYEVYTFIFDYVKKIMLINYVNKLLYWNYSTNYFQFYHFSIFYAI